MDIRNRRALKEEAGIRLSQANYNPRRLALLHTAVSVGVALLVSLLDYYLNHQIEEPAVCPDWVPVPCWVRCR